MSTDSPTSSIPTLFAGRYRLGPRKGNAVELATFDATDVQLQRRVVIKIIHPQLLTDSAAAAAFEDNIQAVAGIRHPNLAHVLDAGHATWNGQAVQFVVEEYLSGGSLRELLDRGRTLSPSQALMVGLDVCKGLDALHRAGLVHADVRPSTIVFGDDRRLRLVDGAVGAPLATHMFDDHSSILNDRAAYASPEQALGQPVAARSDVYALSLLLIEAVSGSVPFAGDSATATLGNRVGKLMPVSADLGALAPVLERAGRPDLADRATAAEFGRALMQAAEKLPRPRPLPLIGVIAPPESTGMHPAIDPTGPLQRPAESIEVPAPASSDLAIPPLGNAPTADSLDTMLVGEHDARPTMALPTTGTVPQPAPEPVIAPARRGLSRRALAGICAAILVGGGALSWVLTNPTIKTVPDVIGLSEGEARNVLEPLGFTVTTEKEASDDVPLGNAIRTRPLAGTSLDVTVPVVLVVSSGPSLRALPELTGLTATQADQALSQLGLILEQGEPAFDETVPVGTILRWSVPTAPTLTSGDLVERGTTVSIIVSAGPQPRVVPDLTGLTLEAATAELAALGLELRALPDEFSSDIEIGRVVSQSPTAGEAADRGATVSLALSKGPDFVAMPEVEGLSVADATAALATAGLAAGSVIGDPGTAVIGARAEDRPVVAGAQIVRGTVVDLITAPDPAATTTAPPTTS